MTLLKEKRISADVISEVKQRADLVTVISEHIALRKSGKDYMGLCPFHEDKSPSFSVSPTKQLYYCFGCTAGGDAIKFLMEIGRNSFEEVVTSLAHRYNIFIPEIVPQNSQNPVKECRVPVSPTESTELARLPNRPTDIPNAISGRRTQKLSIAMVTSVGYNASKHPTQPSPKGYSKITLPWHINEQGEAVNKKGTHPWQPYRLDEVDAICLRQMVTCRRGRKLR
jgi:hypothetical protein